MCLRALRAPAAVVLVLAAGALLGSGASASASASQATMTVANSVPAPVESGAATEVGAHNPAAVQQLLVGLQVRNSARLNRLIAGRVVLSKAQYAASYAPTAKQAATLSAWLKAQGLRVTGVAPQNLWVKAQGSTRQVERAFGVSINDYRLNGRVFYANNQEPTLPTSLRVIEVPGLSDYYTAHTDLSHAVRSAVKRPAAGVSPDALSPFCPNILSSAYAVNHNASGQTIDMVLWGAPMTSTDISLINSECPSTQALSVGSGADQVQFISDGGSSSDTSSWDEVSLDIDNGHGIAPGSHINYYLGGPTRATPYTSEQDAVNDPASKIISNSWGSNGDGSDLMFEGILQMGASEGKTIFFSTGDSSQIEYPSTSPNVVGVGGTSLTTDINNNWAGESTWDDAGRGCSAAQSQPSWEDGISCNGRATPDVSADADPATGAWACFNGSCVDEGGTSLAAPLWAGITADWNSEIHATDGGVGVGFAAPVLWRTSPTCAPQIFSNNITSNDNGTTIEKWPGGNPTLGTAPCTINVHQPSGDIDLIGGTVGDDSWSVNSVSGFTAANVSQVEIPNCLSVLSGGSVTLNRPTCSNASTVFESGRSTDTAYFNATPFHDIVSGSTGGVSAGIGWDNATGWGSPIFGELVNSKITQAINFPVIPTHTYGTPAFTITPTASSALALTVASTTPSVCSVTSNSPNPGWTVSILNGGTCSIQASQAGDSTYPAATSVTQSFTINKQNQTISFAAIPTHTFGDSDFDVTPNASSGLPVSVSSTTLSCLVFPDGVGGTIVAITAAGTCTLDANQAGNGGYNAAPQVAQSFTVNKANQTITFNPIAKQTLPGAPFGVTPTATSGLGVTVVSDTTSTCTVSSNTVSLVAPGTCVLTASQPGNANINAAAPVGQEFDVSTKNLIKNGGFETPKLAGGAAQTYFAGHSFGNWHVTGGSIDLVNQQWQSAAGVQSIDLAGDSPGTITQTVTLPYSGTYTLKFAYAGNPDGLPTRKHLLVAADAPTWGTPVTVNKTFVVTGHTTALMGWKKGGKLGFTGTVGDVVTLIFSDQDANTSYGVAVDAITMKAG